MGERLWTMLAFALAFLCLPATAWADGRLVALVSPVEEDKSIKASLPPFYSAPILRRELETALEATGLFTVPTRDRQELDPVLKEVIATHRGSSKIVGAQVILSPTVQSITLDQRRRRAPNMASKDLVSVTGSVALSVLVLDARTGAVQTRMSVSVRYVGPDRLADPLPNDQLTRSDAVHLPTGSSDFVALSQATGRAFAKRVLDQVNPVLIAQKTDNRVYLTRGQEAGYQVGETLRIIRLGPEIRHPVTHEVLGRDEQQIGVVRIVEVQPRLSIAQVTQTIGDIRVGDIVREPVEDPED